MLALALVLILGVTAPLLDTTMVNVAVPTLRTDLHTSVATIQWVATAYLLALAVAIPVTGWASQRFGARRVWITGLWLFLIGSVLSGLAWNAGSLIGFRVLQGAGAGLLIPIMQTLLFSAAGGRPGGSTLAVISLPALLGPVLGPVIGGLIVGHVDWRWIFYVNPPICLAAILLAMRYLPRDAGSAEHRLDLTGFLLLSPGLASLVYGLSQLASHSGWIVWGPLAGGVALIAVFAWHALRSTAPLVDLRLFKVRSFSAASSLMFLAGMSSFGALLLLPLYYQQLRGDSVVMAGLLMAPQGVGIALSRVVGGALDRLGIRTVVLLSLLLLIAGTVPFALAGTDTSPWLLGAALVVRGAGLGAILMAVLFGAYDGLAKPDIPHASTTTRIAQQLGGSFGTAVLAVALQRGVAAHATNPVAGFQHAFWWAVALTVPALLAVGFLPKRKTPAPAPAAPELTEASA